MKEVEIIVRFPNEEIADKFIGQMMDGFGEGMCDFTHWYKKPGTSGKNRDDYEKIYDPEGRLVCYVNKIFNDDEEE